MVLTPQTLVSFIIIFFVYGSRTNTRLSGRIHKPNEKELVKYVTLYICHVTHSQ
jgi:hypothetical protein